MADLIQYMVSGVALGAIYALVALGFVVIYRASKVFNFAHGEFLTFGALLMALLHSPHVEPEAMTQLGAPAISGFGLPWVVSLIITVVMSGVLAASIERVVLRHLEDQRVALEASDPDAVRIIEAILSDEQDHHDKAASHLAGRHGWLERALDRIVGASTEAVIWIGMKL